jgi:hypothetical protein
MLILVMQCLSLSCTAIARYVRLEPVVLPVPFVPGYQEGVNLKLLHD